MFVDSKLLQDQNQMLKLFCSGGQSANRHSEKEHWRYDTTSGETSQAGPWMCRPNGQSGHLLCQPHYVLQVWYHWARLGQ